MALQPTITTTNLTKHYRSVDAVNQVSLRVGAGEIYAFLGLNGAGKTTTIRMLLGMIRPTTGNAHILGKLVDADTTSLWSEVGYLVETPSVYPELTVRENLDISRRLHRLRDSDCVTHIIERLALTQYADHQVRTLSLGNAQRLGLAKALIHQPRVLILDEPANALDPAGVVEVRELLRELAQQGVTIFMSSHLLSEAARIATRFGIIHQGRLVVEMDAPALEQQRQRWLVIDARDREAARVVLVAAGYTISHATDGILILTDEAAIIHPEMIVQRLAQEGIALTRVSVEEEDLETQFLRIVGGKEEAQHYAIHR